MPIADRENVGFFRRIGSSSAVTIAAVAGSIVGGIVGALIPIPIVGSLMGSAVGTAIGTAIGGAVAGLAMNTFGYTKDKENTRAENSIISRLNQQLQTQGAHAQLGYSLQTIVDLGFRPAFVKHVAEQLKQESINAKIDLSVQIARSPKNPVLDQQFKNWDSLYKQASAVVSSSSKLSKKGDSRTLVSAFMKSDEVASSGMTTDHVTAHRYVPPAPQPAHAVPLPFPYQPAAVNGKIAPPSPNGMGPSFGMLSSPHIRGYNAQPAAYGGPAFR